jgi:NAD(P)-dependent dehydrogenase (short-subunit alcohol dehydrogenase family)
MPARVLDGKVIVIVGASSGIGASALAACVAAGARVVGVEPEAATRQVVESEAVKRLVGDARHAGTARAAIRLALEAFSGFDGLYHVAGGSGRSFGDGPLHAISDAGWSETLRLNLDSSFNSARAATECFLERKRPGSVVLTSSVLARFPSPTHFATHAYAAAKAGILGLVTAAASHYAPQGVRFNAILPGLVDTPMSARAMGDPRIQAFVRERQPLDGGRIGQPADLDGAALFLLSDQSRFVTGQCLAVDGGWSVSDAGRRDA